MPIGDWQFWLVTVIAVFAFAFIVRPLLPSRKQRGSCGNCASGAAASRRKRSKVALTIEQKRV